MTTQITQETNPAFSLNLDTVEEAIAYFRAIREEQAEPRDTHSHLMITAQLANEDLVKIGQRKLKRIKLIIPEGYVNPEMGELILVRSDTSKIKPDTTDAKYALKALYTYRTLAIWKQRVDEHRRLHELGDLL